jgi:hypothetical protein
MQFLTNLFRNPFFERVTHRSASLQGVESPVPSPNIATLPSSGESSLEEAFSDFSGQVEDVGGSYALPPIKRRRQGQEVTYNNPIFSDNKVRKYHLH